MHTMHASPPPPPPPPPGGAGADDASEIAWIYGPAAQACYWLSEKGAPHDVGPFYRQAANLNVFARIEREDGFYKESARLQRYGQQRIRLTKIPTLSPSIKTATAADISVNAAGYGDKLLRLILAQKLPKSASDSTCRAVLNRISALLRHPPWAHPGGDSKLSASVLRTCAFGGPRCWVVSRGRCLCCGWIVVKPSIARTRACHPRLTLPIPPPLT